jgi:hypothetical protein
MDEFISHWEAVNLELGGAPATDLKLKGGYLLANFQTDRAGLAAAITAIEGLENVRQLGAADRDTKKAAIRARLAQFRSGVLCYLQGTPYEPALPTQPDFNNLETRFVAPLDDMANLWTKINADLTTPGWTPPLKLAAGYLAATFSTDLAAMRTTYQGLTDAEQDLKLGRDQRDALLRPIVLRIKQYRGAVISQFADTHPLVASLPALTPPAGSTPDPVAVSGLWNAATLMGDLTWTPSAEADLDFYSVRTAPGPTYKNDEESVVASVPAGTTTFSTAVGLAAPGASALFKVYVVVTTGNERGSAVVKITRPA